MLPVNNDDPHRLFAHKKARLIATMALVLYCVPGIAQRTQPQKPVVPRLGVQIVPNGNEPELHVDGVPFFIHAAQFDYFRIPADLWFQSLERYRELGINTIDLRIPWNWHETRDADFDFDGHTNPRRDLRTLLKLIAQKKTSREIAAELFISPRTVEAHRANISAKLELRGSHSLLQFALENRSAL